MIYNVLLIALAAFGYYVCNSHLLYPIFDRLDITSTVIKEDSKNLTINKKLFKEIYYENTCCDSRTSSN